MLGEAFQIAFLIGITSIESTETFLSVVGESWAPTSLKIPQIFNRDQDEKVVFFIGQRPSKRERSTIAQRCLPFQYPHHGVASSLGDG